MTVSPVLDKTGICTHLIGTVHDITDRKAAEDALRASGVPFTILRPVLIYGPGVKGNFARLRELARKPWPLPLGLCRNRRSLLARRNLIDAVHFAATSPAAKGETYVVADPDPLTLAEIVTALRAGEGRSAGLLPVPPGLIALTASALGRAEGIAIARETLAAMRDRIAGVQIAAATGPM